MPLRDGSPEDYHGAAIRHFRDASALMDSGSLDNAGHLIGFAAECAIKHRVGSLGSDENRGGGHLPHMLAAARKRLGERASYVSMFNLLKNGVFTDWDVNERYSATGKVTTDQLTEWVSVTKRLLAAANIRARNAV